MSNPSPLFPSREKPTFMKVISPPSFPLKSNPQNPFVIIKFSSPTFQNIASESRSQKETDAPIASHTEKIDQDNPSIPDLKISLSKKEDLDKIPPISDQPIPSESISILSPKFNP